MPKRTGNVVSVCLNVSENNKAWFSYVRKVADNRGFYFLTTIADFADILDIRQRSVPDLPETIRLFVIWGLGPSNLGDWSLSEIHRRRTPTSPTVQI